MVSGAVIAVIIIVIIIILAGIGVGLYFLLRPEGETLPPPSEPPPPNEPPPGGESPPGGDPLEDFPVIVPPDIETGTCTPIPLADACTVNFFGGRPVSLFNFTDRAVRINQTTQETTYYLALGSGTNLNAVTTRGTDSTTLSLQNNRLYTNNSATITVFYCQLRSDIQTVQMGGFIDVYSPSSVQSASRANILFDGFNFFFFDESGNFAILFHDRNFPNQFIWFKAQRCDSSWIGQPELVEINFTVNSEKIMFTLV